MSNLKGKFVIYKGLKGTNGVFQFVLGPAIEKEGKLNNGAIFVEAAPATGKNIYDWDKKIMFAISINDVVQIFGSANGEFKLTHVYDGEVKRLTVQKGQEYGYFMSITAGSEDGSGENNRAVKVPVSDGEYQVLRSLLMSSVPDIIGWRGVQC